MLLFDVVGFALMWRSLWGSVWLTLWPVTGLCFHTVTQCLVIFLLNVVFSLLIWVFHWRQCFMFYFVFFFTGFPKAAVITHLQCLKAAGGFWLFGATKDDVIYIPLPLYHSAASLIGIGGTIELGRRLNIFCDLLHIKLLRGRSDPGLHTLPSPDNRQLWGNNNHSFTFMTADQTWLTLDGGRKPE